MHTQHTSLYILIVLLQSVSLSLTHSISLSPSFSFSLLISIHPYTGTIYGWEIVHSVNCNSWLFFYFIFSSKKNLQQQLQQQQHHHQLLLKAVLRWSGRFGECFGCWSCCVSFRFIIISTANTMLAIKSVDLKQWVCTHRLYYDLQWFCSFCLSFGKHNDERFKNIDATFEDRIFSETVTIGISASVSVSVPKLFFFSFCFKIIFNPLLVLKKKMIQNFVWCNEAYLNVWCYCCLY